MCMEVAGGRKWAELGVSRKVIRDVIVDIASNLAADLNGVIQKKLVKYEIQKGEVAVQIAGSVRAMELEPDKQIYMDICMRLCELKFNSIKVSEEMLEKEVLLAVRNKGLFTKKEIIEARVSKEEITCIAKEKLEDNWYQVFEQVIKCNSEADFVDICKMSR